MFNDTIFDSVHNFILRIVHNVFVCLCVYCMHLVLCVVDFTATPLTTEVDARSRLRSASVSTLVPSTRRSTLGDRAFPVAAARAWNNLPASVRSAYSFAEFCQQLKTFLFRACYSLH